MIPLLIDWNSRLLSSLSLTALDQPILAASSRNLPAFVVGMGLVLSVILTALFCGLYYLDRYRRGLPVDDPNSMFRELCRGHDLSGAERRLLKRLASGLELASPSVLFVDSSIWRLPDGSDRHQRLSKADWEKLLKLQCTLFLPPPAKVVA